MSMAYIVKLFKAACVHDLSSISDKVMSIVSSLSTHG